MSAINGMFQITMAHLPTWTLTVSGPVIVANLPSYTGALTRTVDVAASFRNVPCLRDNPGTARSLLRELGIDGFARWVASWYMGGGTGRDILRVVKL